MNLVRVASVTTLLMVFGDQLIAGGSVEATLVVPDARILPGVPFDFWVELHNRSDSQLRISVCEPFQLRQVSGEPFSRTETGEQMTHRQLYWGDGGEAFVGPGETKVLAIPAESGLMAGRFFRERLLSAPGRRFAITLPLCQQPGVWSGDPPASSRLMTSEVEIEIVSPSGSDARVWKLIEDTSKHRWTPADMRSPESRAMWQTVLRDFPDSSYVPYAILMTSPYLIGDLRDRLAGQLRTIEHFSDSPILEWVHLEAWRTARALRLHGVMLAEGSIVRQSKRPTTQFLAFGNERR